MVTTNIAITTAQKGRGRENIPKWELEALDKYEPSFLIEHLDDYETYRVHLDGKILILFEEAMHFHQAMEQDFNEESFKALLQRYYVFEDDLLSQELPLLCAHFEPDGDYSKYVQTYEVEEH